MLRLAQGLYPETLDYYSASSLQRLLQNYKRYRSVVYLIMIFGAAARTWVYVQLSFFNAQNCC